MGAQVLTRLVCNTRRLSWLWLITLAGRNVQLQTVQTLHFIGRQMLRTSIYTHAQIRLQVYLIWVNRLYVYLQNV